MKAYSLAYNEDLFVYGINDFIICCGYKGNLIKEYFKNYLLHQSKVTFNLKDNEMEIHQNNTEQWKITLVDTGDNTMTGTFKKSQRLCNK